MRLRQARKILLRRSSNPGAEFSGRTLDRAHHRYYQDEKHGVLGPYQTLTAASTTARDHAMADGGPRYVYQSFNGSNWAYYVAGRRPSGFKVLAAFNSNGRVMRR